MAYTYSDINLRPGTQPQIKLYICKVLKVYLYLQQDPIEKYIFVYFGQLAWKLAKTQSGKGGGAKSTYLHCNSTKFEDLIIMVMLY